MDKRISLFTLKTAFAPLDWPAETKKEMTFLKTLQRLEPGILLLLPKSKISIPQAQSVLYLVFLFVYFVLRYKNELKNIVSIFLLFFSCLCVG